MLTPAGAFIVPGVQWIVNHLSAVSPDLRTASVWAAPWWLYALSFLACFSAVQILAWFEQHSRLREMTGMPQVVLELTVDNTFHVKTDKPAYAVCINEIVLQKPAASMELARKIYASKQAEYLEAGKPFFHDDWKLYFSDLPVIHPGPPGMMACHIAGMTLVPFQVIPYVLGAIATSNEVELPLVLNYSNTGSPKRMWHAHFVLVHHVNPQKTWLRHIDTGEVYAGKTTCSRCKLINGGIAKNDNLLN